MGSVRIHRVYFLEDDVVDGDYTPIDDRLDAHDNVSAVEAARLLTDEGLSFAATGNDWAADPDGSRITNYATGERVEVSGHLSGFPDRVVDAIIRKVG